MAAVHRKAAPGMGALAIGGTVFLTHLVGIPLTNAGINPARTFGPALLCLDTGNFTGCIGQPQ